MTLKPHSHKTADAEGNPMCQLTFHCKWSHNAFSPAFTTSWMEAECVLNTLACSRNGWLAVNVLREDPFPIPYRRDVVSHPRSAWINKMWLQMSGPSICCIALIFQMRVFLCFFLALDKRRGHVTLCLHDNRGEQWGPYPSQLAQCWWMQHTELPSDNKEISNDH